MTEQTKKQIYFLTKDASDHLCHQHSSSSRSTSYHPQNERYRLTDLSLKKATAVMTALLLFLFPMMLVVPVSAKKQEKTASQRYHDNQSYRARLPGCLSSLETLPRSENSLAAWSFPGCLSGWYWTDRRRKA